MHPFTHLTHENSEQLRKYLRFFRQKREGIIRSMQREFMDIKIDKLNEEVYTKDDVSEIIDFTASAIKVVTQISLSFFFCYYATADC